jgi:protein-disulfide isomerase
METVDDGEQDPTREQRREQTRAQPRELDRAEAVGAMRRTWLRQLGIVVAIVAAIIFVVLIAAGCSSQGGTPKPNPRQAKSAGAEGTGAEVTSLLAGIQQRGNTLGDPKAPVTLEYFGDLQCPYCRQFMLGALPSLIQTYVRGGKLKIEYRSLESATRNPATFKAQQVAALAAGTQNKMWPYIELFYREEGRENSGYVTERYLQRLAQQVPGLNLPAWTAARSETGLAEMIRRDARAAYYVRYRGTPSFLIGEAGGRFWRFNPGTLTQVSPYAHAIEEVLRSGHPGRLSAPREYRAVGLARVASPFAGRHGEEAGREAAYLDRDPALADLGITPEGDAPRSS